MQVFTPKITDSLRQQIEVFYSSGISVSQVVRNELRGNQGDLEEIGEGKLGTKQIIVRLDDEDSDRLEQVAKRNSVSKSEALRRIIAAFVKKNAAELVGMGLSKSTEKKKLFPLKMPESLYKTLKELSQSGLSMSHIVREAIGQHEGPLEIVWPEWTKTKIKVISICLAPSEREELNSLAIENKIEASTALRSLLFTYIKANSEKIKALV